MILSLDGLEKKGSGLQNLTHLWSMARSYILVMACGTRSEGRLLSASTLDTKVYVGPSGRSLGSLPSCGLTSGNDLK